MLTIILFTKSVCFQVWNIRNKYSFILYLRVIWGEVVISRILIDRYKSITISFLIICILHPWDKNIDVNNHLLIMCLNFNAYLKNATEMWWGSPCTLRNGFNEILKDDILQLLWFTFALFNCWVMRIQGFPCFRYFSLTDNSLYRIKYYDIYISVEF